MSYDNNQNKLNSFASKSTWLSLFNDVINDCTTQLQEEAMKIRHFQTEKLNIAMDRLHPDVCLM